MRRGSGGESSVLRSCWGGMIDGRVRLVALVRSDREVKLFSVSYGVCNEVASLAWSGMSW